VLFIYITSLASNELISINPIKQLTFFVSIILSSCLIFNNLNIQQQINLLSAHGNKAFNFMYSNNTFVLTITTIIYLLLTLIIVVKVSNKFEAPLKSKIFL